MLGLPDDWLNDAAKGYAQGLSRGPVLLEAPPLVVRTLAPAQLLAMKLCAWRDDLDVSDARLLLSKLGPKELAVAAGVAELLAARAGQSPPVWTAGVPAAPEPILLVRAASFLPRLRRLCEEEGPEPLRRTGILAPPGFLTAA